MCFLRSPRRDEGEQRDLLAGSHFHNKITCSWNGGRPLILCTCLGLRAVNNQQPGPFFPPFLGHFKSPLQSVMGKMPTTQDLRAISQNSFANQNGQARSAFSDFTLGKFLGRYLWTPQSCLLGDIPIEFTQGQQLPSGSP